MEEWIGQGHSSSQAVYTDFYNATGMIDHLVRILRSQIL